MQGKAIAKNTRQGDVKPSGRRLYSRRSATEWASIVNAQRLSGQTTQSFCEEHGIAKSTFECWKQRINQGKGNESVHHQPRAPRFIELPITGAAASLPTDAAEISFDEKTRIRFEGTLARRIAETVIARLETRRQS